MCRGYCICSVAHKTDVDLYYNNASLIMNFLVSLLYSSLFVMINGKLCLNGHSCVIGIKHISSYYYSDYSSVLNILG